MHALAVQIVRFVDDAQPGFVECEFLDADGKLHILFDKVPIFTAENLYANSAYPQPGIADCQLLAQWTDDQGRDLARITTAIPFAIESRDGLSEFVVLSAQLVVHTGEST